MTDFFSNPITVKAGTAPVAAAARYLIVMLGTAAVSRGWVDLTNVEGLATALVTLGTAGYGLWRTHRAKKDLVRVANAVSDAVAVVKP